MSQLQELIVKVSAPGKIILHGEHSVVYGKLAIAASLDLRTTVSLEEKKNDKLEIDFVDLKFRQVFDLQDIKSIFQSQELPVQETKNESIYLHPENINHTELIQTIKTSLHIQEETLSKNKYSSLISLLYLYFGIIQSSKTPLEALLITVQTELSLGSGTGSSASLMVSLAGAFLRYITLKDEKIKLHFQGNSTILQSFNELQLDLISKWGFAAERIIHGNPSGIDNTVCTYGSMVSFRKGRAPIAVKCNRDITGIIVDTTVPKNTAEMVQKVADLKSRRPMIVDCILDALENLTDEALEILIQIGDDANNLEEEWYTQLGELSSLNHNLLRTLGVSHPSLDDIVTILSKKNLQGKLTGAGGGGYAVALIPPQCTEGNTSEVCLQLAGQGYQPLVTKLGGMGVRIEVD